MIGYLWAAISILLISGAQISMKWAMIQLPPLNDLQLLTEVFFKHHSEMLVLAGGLLAYLLSTWFWFLALHYLPLSGAYPLLSISYILVWFAASFIPDLNEKHDDGSFIGVILIICGILMISGITWRKS